MTQQDDTIPPGIGGEREKMRQPGISATAAGAFAIGIGSAAIVAALIFARRSTVTAPALRDDRQKGT